MDVLNVSDALPGLLHLDKPNPAHLLVLFENHRGVTKLLELLGHLFKEGWHVSHVKYCNRVILLHA